MKPTSEIPTPTFLKRIDADNRLQPLVRHRRAAATRCHSRLNRSEALRHLFFAIECRNQSFIGFRGDLWRDWRAGMREEALAYRRAVGTETKFHLNAA